MGSYDDESIEEEYEDFAGMSLPDILLSITKECPYYPIKKSCPIKEIEELRKLAISKAYKIISDLPADSQKELVRKHIHCSYTLACDIHGENKCFKKGQQETKR
jgi:hypothetical protein